MELDTESKVLESLEVFKISKDFRAAQKILEDGIKRFPDSKAILLQAHNNCRALGDLNAAVVLSSRLRDVHPDYFDSYARLTQDFNSLKKFDDAVSVIEEGLIRFPSDKWILLAALQTYRHLDRIKDAVACGETLAERHSDFVQFYRPYFDILLICGNYGAAQELLARTAAGVERAEMHLNLLLSQRMYDEYFSELERYVSLFPMKSTDYARRLRDFSILQKEPSDQRHRVDSDVDIICIASDEAPYISDFIHHYTYLGFKRIFVGLNNCSDDTQKIIEKIAGIFPNVFVIDVNAVISAFKQSGCYAHLFEYARKESSSKYCMFVDVDEFWVADPFPSTIQTFMKDIATCDCISFQWINILGESIFARPLALSGKIGINPHVKSLVRYDSEYIGFGAHAPTIANIESPRTHLGRDPVANHRKTPTGYAVHQITPASLMPKLQDKGLG
ncbi:MAG: glycosyltransferase family 2 protein [Pseudotabrizicola sp.]|uniref:glycosyltransferase family 2 protein n=1 Tax=Pseudotabrizicola sp. TaxID=2939647 RepID=UPI002731B94C|nr:glycosyltransferase family 2 protein [Pseudotabrizicola sp.]MDP2080443.1 glycosyltransferase family 2 protein [Pseudotabrizicola sp.]MDZ7573713.1 glycosyltransferase family 2 protein [Pseudotabrizicola sp.]